MATSALATSLAAPLVAATATTLKLLRGVGRGVLGLALPPTCVACGRVVAETGGLCAACWSRLVFITPPYCPRMGTPLPYDPGENALGLPWTSAEALDDPPAFDRARAAVVFTDVARDLVHNLKYADQLDLALPMARLMAQAGAELIAEADVLVPVPLHALKLWRRRFNQAALLARRIAAQSALHGVTRSVRTDLLGRRRGTTSQTRLSRAERRANVAGAFICYRTAASVLAGRRVLLIDDVYTTGATIDACARALRRAGAAHVDVLTFARVVDFA